MFSDGLERLILDMQRPHRALAQPAPDPGLAGRHRAPCGRRPFARAGRLPLGSANVNRRTDDDKTLVMATRAAPPEAAP